MPNAVIVPARTMTEQEVESLVKRKPWIKCPSCGELSEADIWTDEPFRVVCRCRCLRTSILYPTNCGADAEALKFRLEEFRSAAEYNDAQPRGWGNCGHFEE
jgi:hypothetical protein